MRRNQIIELCSGLLVLLFIYAATSKFMDIPQFRADMENQPFPKWLADTFVYLVPTVEIIISVMLIYKPLRKWGFMGASLLMFAFTAYTAAILLNFFPRIPCGCGGVITKLTWHQHLALNVFFLTLSILGLILIVKGRHFGFRRNIVGNFKAGF